MLQSIFNLTTLYWVLMVFYVPSCIGLIVIVLLQKGKGTGFAGAFGIGAGSETVFGPRSSQSLPVKLTYVAAFLFMFIALVMSIIAGGVGKGQAPELVAVDTEAEILGTGLEKMGLGTNVSSDAAPTDAVLAPGDTQSEGADTPLTPSDAPPAEIETFEEVDEAVGSEEPSN